MTSVIVAWVLLGNPASYSILTVSNIATEEECVDLAKRMQFRRFECHPYKVVK